jgi:hypothetical protein
MIKNCSSDGGGCIINKFHSKHPITEDVFYTHYTVSVAYENHLCTTVCYLSDKNTQIHKNMFLPYKLLVTIFFSTSCTLFVQLLANNILHYIASAD